MDETIKAFIKKIQEIQGDSRMSVVGIMAFAHHIVSMNLVTDLYHALDYMVELERENQRERENKALEEYYKIDENDDRAYDGWKDNKALEEMGD